MVKYNSKYRHGKYSKTITVYSNDVEEPVIRLTLKVFVKNKEDEEEE